MKIMDKFHRTAQLFFVMSLLVLPTISHAAGTMKDYCIVPPFIGINVPSNLLLMIDNSSSMWDLAYTDQGNKDSSGSITREPFFCYDQSYRGLVCSNNSLVSCSTNADCGTGKVCSNNSQTACTVDADCGAGNTCNVKTCIANVYAGYFNDNSYYDYNFTNKYFATTASLPATCDKSIANTLCVGLTAGQVTSFTAKGNYLNWLVASKFDIEKEVLTGGKYVGKLCYDDGNPTDRACSENGDCLSGESCTAVTTSFLQGESRGCLGQGYVKDAISADFVNYAASETNPNAKIGLAFKVRGPVDSVNASAPSRGGQSYIDIYNGFYNSQQCENASTLWNTSNVQKTELQNAVEACLNYNSSTSNPNYCYGDHSMTGCTIDADCTVTTAGSIGKCNKDTSLTCWTDNDCRFPVGGTPGRCDYDSSITCWNDAACTDYTVMNGHCSQKHAGAYDPCATDADCGPVQQNGERKYGVCLNAYGVIHSCNNPSPAPASTDDRGPCNSPLPVAAGTHNYGPCVNPTQSVVVKTKIAFTETVQTCWSYLNSPTHTLGTGDLSRLTTGAKCVDVYDAGLCSADPSKGCTSDSDCGSGTCVKGPGVCLSDNNKVCATDTNCAVGTCTKGPQAILAGNAATICSNSYLGAYYTGSAPDWQNNWSNDEAGMIQAYKDFCDANQPAVIDPSDSAADSPNYEKLPAILGGIGVEAQLGTPIGELAVRINTGGAPSGLVQEFADRLRIGAMSFNFSGSASEAAPAVGATLVAPKVCSNEATRLCNLDKDCVSPGTCGTASNNLDGARILYPIGKGLCATVGTTPCQSSADCGGLTCYGGLCATMHSTVCTNDTKCSSVTQGDICISDGVGDHAAGFVNIVDGIKANAWTPFAEAFYDAIGYFARTATNTSRTDLRLNAINPGGDYTPANGVPVDFNLSLNPSNYRCQQNYVLLITDGSSTADRNSSVATMAQLYSGANAANLAATTCPNYAGSTYLPIMAWIGKHLNIADVSKTSPATLPVCSNDSSKSCAYDSDCLPAPPALPPNPAPTCLYIPRNGRENITTYVVSTGGSNGLTGACNSQQMMADTAAKGGTTLRQANNPQELMATLRNVFEELAAKSASGTAASILSNSEGSGANILQAVFYPRKVFQNQTESYWLGEMQNLWYYVDPFIGRSSMREDSTPRDWELKLKSDDVVQFWFDNAAGVTKVNLLHDGNGDGTGDTPVAGKQGVSPDDVSALWRAGDKLWSRDLSASPRTIYTPCVSGGDCVTGTGLMKFNFGTYPAEGTGSITITPDNSSVLAASLQYPGDNDSARKLMKYVHGFDYPGDATVRSRTVKIGNVPAANLTDAAYVNNPRDKGIGVWKLGDIISSTPRTQSSVRQNAYNLPKPSGYSDTSYGNDDTKKGYIYTDGTGANGLDYKGRGMVYVGANDGMLHAFRLGKLDVSPSGDRKATLTNPDAGTNLGDEAWAFIPRNVLPYLKYYADQLYREKNHLYYVDGRTTIVDASIGKPTGCTGDYWGCGKDFPSGSNIGGSNWRTVLVGGMGIGGASRDKDDPGNCVEGASGTCVRTPVAGVGYSSYYALDVTHPNSPKFLWEFSDAAIPDDESGNRGLGFATTGAAIVKISARTDGAPDNTKNGRWFAVFGSGPTGPIDSGAGRKFLGTSNQPLKIYVVDLNATPPFTSTGTNPNYWVISDVYDGGSNSGATVDNTTPAPLPNAFVSSMTDAAIDTDRWASYAPGFYQDNALYFGYTRKIPFTVNWRRGGVLRLVTNEDPNPANWKLSKVFETGSTGDVQGPITSGISRLQDRKNHNLWLYFGTGRYYYFQDDMGDVDHLRQLFGIKDPCYKNDATFHDTIDPACVVKVPNTVCSDLNLFETDCITNQNTAAHTSVAKGWKIALDGPGNDANGESLGGERVISDPVAMTNGGVFFTTYRPNSNFCQFGGNSYLWAVKYDTGGQAPDAALQGKALVQVSTGEFKEIDLSTVFTDRDNRRMGTAMTGKPPEDPPPIVSKSNNKPVKRIIHIQER